MKNLFKIANGILLLTLASSSYAVDLDAGDYDAPPVGTNLALLYLQHASRDTLYVGSHSVPGENTLVSDVGIARFVHYTDIAGFTVAPQILIPFGRIEGSDNLASLGSVNGLGDVVLAAPVWLLNDASAKQYFGITPYLFLPTGKYSENDALNFGENRYKLNVQTVYSTRLSDKVAWDNSADVTFYGDNKDAVGGGTLEQDFGYQLQSNARYFVSDKADLRAGISYADFGKTQKNGIESDAVTQSKFWVGTAYAPTASTHVILTYGQDLKVENTFKEDHRIQLRLLKVF